MFSEWVSRRFPVSVAALFGFVAFSGCIFEPVDPQPSPPVGDPAPGAWGSLDEATVRPGAKVFARDRTGLTTTELQCTLGFVFTTPDDASVFISTASHCVVGKSVGDVILLGAQHVEGLLIYCSYGTIIGTSDCPEVHAEETGDPPHPNDFALIRIPAASRGHVHPAVLGIGGPTGVTDGVAPDDLLVMYGNSRLRDGDEVGGSDARAGRVYDDQDWRTIAYFSNHGVEGDSGAPVMEENGRALGIYHGTGRLEDCPGEGPHVDISVPLPRALAYVEEHKGLELELQTWPLLAPPAAAHAPAAPC